VIVETLLTSMYNCQLADKKGNLAIGLRRGIVVLDNPFGQLRAKNRRLKLSLQLHDYRTD